MAVTETLVEQACQTELGSPKHKQKLNTETQGSVITDQETRG